MFVISSSPDRHRQFFLLQTSWCHRSATARRREGALEVPSLRHKLGTAAAAAAAARLNNEARAAAAFKATGTRLINDELCDTGVPSPARHFHQRTQVLILGWVLKLK